MSGILVYFVLSFICLSTVHSDKQRQWRGPTSDESGGDDRPSKRAAHGFSAGINGTIYLFGGFSSGEHRLHYK